MRKIAIIGGTGIYDADFLEGFESKIIDTPYGQAACKIGELYGNQVVFITRHGVNHSTPPHKVNYRANIWALKSLGVQEIFATTAVGSLRCCTYRPVHIFGILGKYPMLQGRSERFIYNRRHEGQVHASVM